jgi:molybdopterin/thiamine biosynthesis adenylyltransferase/rhodanese-related sulfurtransferase
MEANSKLNSDNIKSSQSTPLTKEEIERYCRQVILPEIGTEGQLKLKNSKVLVVGAGGLGSPCLLYLAGAGIGEIGIIDGDCVDTSNLHRQVIHQTANKGINKARSAEMMIRSFNPMIKVTIYEEHLSNKNGLKIAKNYDLLIDCCDNPATRYLTNDLCVVLNKPLVSGSAVKWEGQLTVYVKDSTSSENSNKLPCYRCLFPLPTPPSAVCNCGDSGVFGPVPGVIGTLQANETVKLLIGANEKILAKRMLTYDAYEMTFKIFKMRNYKDECIACGKEENRRINIDNIESYDYEEFTNPKSCRIERRVQIEDENNKKWSELIDLINKSKSMEEIVLLDVRAQEQFEMFNFNSDFESHLKIEEGVGTDSNDGNDLKFKNIPLKDLQDNYDTYQNIFSEKNDKQIFVMCRAGNLSTHAVKFLLSKGLKNVYNLEDGIHGYIKEIDSQKTPFY